MDLIGVALVARSPIEGSRVVLRYPPLKREVSPETLQALGPLANIPPSPAPAISATPALSTSIPGSMPLNPSIPPTSGSLHSSSGWCSMPDLRPASPAPLPSMPSSSVTTSVIPAPPSPSLTSSAAAASQETLSSLDYSAFALSSVVLAPALTPKPTLCDRPFSLWLGDTLFIGRPTIVPPTRQTSGQDVNFFHLVFVLSNGPDVHKVRARLIEASVQLAEALKHEEVPILYIPLHICSSDVDLLLLKLLRFSNARFNTIENHSNV